MKLIINADDFGLTSLVTYGIFDCMKNGIVTSTTQMMNTRATLQASEIVRDNLNLKVGLHLNISLGKPLTNCSSLVEDGHFIKPKNLKTDDLYDEQEIYCEIKAQYDKFLELNKRKPTHLDSHLYVHQVFEKVKRQVIRLSEEENIPVREQENKFYQEIYFERRFRVLEDETFNEVKAKFIRLINENKDKEIVEIMVHPGYIDDDILNSSSYSNPRLIEAAVLLDKDVREYIINNGIELISYLDVEKKQDGRY